MQDYEKLGVFYLGREYDLAAHKTGTREILYDSKDLVTHTVCVGMTGSGKTGLCLAILEEAAIDNIPAIVIDPKGDLTNLLLTFPNLAPSDFEPWVNPDDASRQGVSTSDFAAAQAKLWADGLAKWDQDGDRIKRLRAASEFAIFTPGSNAGIPVSILKSFDIPEQAILDDSELLADRISTTATSLLGLLGIDADPIQSREHILISNILSSAWTAGQKLDLAGLIQQIQQPPMQKIGVIDLESFFPQKDRFALAMKLNNLLASPAFSQWLAGVPLDINAMLYTPTGKPRIAIFSIAHLGDAERMFFVSLLLNQTLGWMRTQGGTTSLRALLYMDEIFGYFPPTANPPSKQPLLTLLKQARAFGLGVMLATQNPVDLDYKGLANCGTWFIGRLQTERDKARLLDGLASAAAGNNQKFDASKMSDTLAGLGSRVFLMNNVHDDAPTVFESRWCMSYLRGPLGKPEIKRLMDPVRATFTGTTPPTAASATVAITATAVPDKAHPMPGVGSSNARPILPPGIAQYFFPIRGASIPNATLTYVPMLFGTADVYFNDKPTGVNTTQPKGLLAPITTNPVPVEWTTANPCDVAETDLEKQPEPSATFAPVPPGVSQQKQFDTLAKAFADGLFRISTLDVFTADDLDLTSTPGETEAAFRARLTQTAREQRDAATDALRKKYQPKLDALEDRHTRAQQAVQRESAQASSAKWSAAISVIGSLASAFLGSKRGVSATTINKVGTAARSAGRAWEQNSDVGRANETVESVEADIAQMNKDLQTDIDALSQKYDPASIVLKKVTLRPKKTDIKPRVVALAWVPNWQDASGTLTPAM